MEQKQDEECWWIRPRTSLSEMTNSNEQAEFEKRDDGILPARFQDEYLEVIKPELKVAYEYARIDILNRLIALDSNLTILEALNGSSLLGKIDNCLVMSSEQSHFVFHQMALALYGESIILISALLYDKDRTSLGIDRFRTSITNNWIKANYQACFQNEFKVFDKNIARKIELVHKINDYRNNYYAHRNADPKKIEKVKLAGISELREAFNIANSFFSCCTLWCGSYGFLTKDVEVGIGEISDCLIKGGFYVNQVQRLDGCRSMTAEELNRLNESRGKFGLSCITADDLKDGLESQ